MIETQRMRADAVVSKIRLQAIESMVSELRAILEESQNDPPQGGSDGSIANYRWYRYRELCDSLSQVIKTVKDITK